MKPIINLDEVAPRTFNHRGKLGPMLDYWEGE